MLKATTSNSIIKLLKGQINLLTTYLKANHLDISKNEKEYLLELKKEYENTLGEFTQYLEGFEQPQIYSQSYLLKRREILKDCLQVFSRKLNNVTLPKVIYQNEYYSTVRELKEIELSLDELNVCYEEE